MPVYTYHCQGCRRLEDRVAGIDDGVLRCVHCGRYMRRREDLRRAVSAYR